MTDEELIARLRSACFLAFDDGTNDYSSAPDAADRIKALVKQCEELAQAAMNNGQALILAEARIRELEARMASAVRDEAIEESAALVEDLAPERDAQPYAAAIRDLKGGAA